MVVKKRKSFITHKSIKKIFEITSRKRLTIKKTFDIMKPSRKHLIMNTQRHGEEIKTMWVVKNGKVMIMLQDTRRNMKWIYISERKWDAMTAQEKERYI